MKSKNIYAVILAGGSGTRFWPVSRRTCPKQFVDILGQGTLFRQTLDRMAAKISGKNMVVVTGASYQNLVKKQAAGYRLPRRNILLEPSPKNTAPAICWAASRIHKTDPEGIMVVVPSDHLILKKGKFHKALNEAVRLARAGKLVTLGIKPGRPETGYGYLKTVKRKISGRPVHVVERFTEKPSRPEAERFIRGRNYFWNSGIFVWKASEILKEFGRHQPRIYRALGRQSGAAHVRRVWNSLPEISVDYGILEKSDNVVAVPASDIGWSDLGSWESLHEVLAKDARGNILKGNICQWECRNSLIWAKDKLIAAVGAEDMVIIDTPDALLVCPKKRSQDVKNIVRSLAKKQRGRL